MIKNCHMTGHLQPNCQLSSTTLVVNRSDWNRLKGEPNGETGALKMAAEKENRYQEYVKQESRTLNADFKAEIRKKEEEAVQMAKNNNAEVNPRLELMKAADEAERKALIKKAENMIQRHQPDPVNLQSSAILSEVLKIRENQVRFNADQSNDQKAQRKLDAYQTLSQAEAWIAEQNAKHEKEQKVRTSSKRDVLVMLKERRQEKVNERVGTLNLERANKQELDRDVDRQMARESEMLARKRENLRHNALEAMKIAEQRRIRQQLVDVVENIIREAYNEGSDQVAEERRLAKQATNNAHELVKAQAAGILIQQTSPPRVDNTFATYGEIERDAREQERLDRNKRIKAARIQQHMDEMARRERMAEQTLEYRRQSAANRQRNLEVTYQFEKRKQDNQHRQMRDTHAKLHVQMAEKEEAARCERENDKRYNRTNSALAEDRFFYNRTNQLMHDATSKGRPSLPFRKTIIDYKKHAAIKTLQDQQDPPPHLVSQVEMAPALFHSTPKPTRMTKKAYKYEVEELKMMNPYRRYKNFNSGM